MLPKRSMLGELEMMEVYDFFDFPRLFTCRNKSGQVFLSISVEDADHENVFLYSAISNSRYSVLTSGRLPIRDAFAMAENENVYRVTVGSDIDRVEILPCEDIPEDWLSDPAEFIEGAQTKLHERHVESAAQIAQATRRESANFALKLPKNRTDIASRVLGHFLTALQELVDALGQACAGEPTLKGAIPRKILDQTGFLVAQTYPSSFGIQVISEERGDLLEDSLAGDALAKLFELMSIEADEEQLSALLHTLRGRATTKYRSFLETLIDSESDLDVQWGSPKPGRGGEYFMTREVMESTHRIVSAVEQEIGEEIRVYGTLVGLNVRTRSYEIFGIHDKKKYAGKVAEDAPSAIYHAVLSEPYTAVLKRVIEVQATSGEERERWLLVNLLQSEIEGRT